MEQTKFKIPEFLKPYTEAFHNLSVEIGKSDFEEDEDEASDKL